MFSYLYKSKHQSAKGTRTARTPIPELIDLRSFNIQLEKQALVQQASFVLLQILPTVRDESCAGRAFFSPLTIKEVHTRKSDVDIYS